jgi:hypothetical protein
VTEERHTVACNLYKAQIQRCVQRGGNQNPPGAAATAPSLAEPVAVQQRSVDGLSETLLGAMPRQDGGIASWAGSDHVEIRHTRMKSGIPVFTRLSTKATAWNSGTTLESNEVWECTDDFRT